MRASKSKQADKNHLGTSNKKALLQVEKPSH
jgi:hypothetical protein